MRHQKKTLKLNKPSDQRKSMLNTMVKQLITHERIETTDARAKALVACADKIVTIGKKNSLHARRQAYEVLGNRELVKKLFEVIAPRFADRAGGYCRMMYKGFRAGDGARTAIVEFVEGASAPAAVSEDKGTKAEDKK